MKGSVSGPGNSRQQRMRPAPCARIVTQHTVKIFEAHRVSGDQKYFTSPKPTMNIVLASSFATLCRARPPAVAGGEDREPLPGRCPTRKRRSAASLRPARQRGRACRRNGTPQFIVRDSIGGTPILLDREPWPTLGSITISPPRTASMNFCVSGAGQTGLSLPAVQSFAESFCAGKIDPFPAITLIEPRARFQPSPFIRASFKSRSGKADAEARPLNNPSEIRQESHTPAWRRMNSRRAWLHITRQSQLRLQVVAQFSEIGRGDTHSCPAFFELREVMTDVDAATTGVLVGERRAIDTRPDSPASPERNSATLRGLPRRGKR